MGIPTFDRMLRPLLTVAVREDLTRIKPTTAMEQQFNLAAHEREARIPSGKATYVRNRAGWAMTFLTKAGLIEKVAPKTYRATDRGKAFLASHVQDITVKDLEALEGWYAAWRTPNSLKTSVAPADTTNKTPTEILDDAVTTLNADLRTG